MRILFQQKILMNYHALFVIFEKATQFEIVVCCKLWVGLYGFSYTMLVHFCMKYIVKIKMYFYTIL